MAWNFTAYILWRYAERIGASKEIEFRDFLNFVFLELGRKKKVFFHDGKIDLYNDLQYLAELGVIELQEKDRIDDSIIRVRDRLKEVAEALVVFSKRAGIGLMNEYISRIDQAVNELSVSPREVDAE